MFDKVHRFLAPFFQAENYASGASLQERADLFRLLLLAKANHTWPDVTVRSLDQIRELAPTKREQEMLVGDHMRNRTLAHIESWHDHRPPPLDPTDPSTPIAEQRRLEVEREHCERVHQAQMQAFGFALRVAPSSAGPAAGNGVFVSGSVPPGEVIAFYPGVWYEPQHLFEIGRIAEYFK
ncbi:MAG: hypothetical protein SGPRY_009251, partial [Prymnesium sp.]